MFHIHTVLSKSRFYVPSSNESQLLLFQIYQRPLSCIKGLQLLFKIPPRKSDQLKKEAYFTMVSDRLKNWIVVNFRTSKIHVTIFLGKDVRKLQLSYHDNRKALFVESNDRASLFSEFKNYREQWSFLYIKYYDVYCFLLYGTVENNSV